MVSMHVAYCHHCEGPHTLYYNDRHTFLFLSLSLSTRNQHPDTAYDVWNVKKRNIASTKVSSKSDKKQKR